MKDRIKVLEQENEELRSCLESVSRYEKEKHEFELKIAKDIVERDPKAVANVILNMHFGNSFVGFCEIFGLRDAGRCQKHERCTDCIHEWLREQHFEGLPRMTVRDYNEEFLPKIDTASVFIHSLNHAIAKTNDVDECMRQLGCIGWSEECKETIKIALEYYRISVLKR